MRTLAVPGCASATPGPSGVTSDDPVKLFVHVADGHLELAGQAALSEAPRVQATLLALDVAEVLTRDQAPVLGVVLVEHAQQLGAAGLLPCWVGGERPDIEQAALRVVVVR